MSYRVLATKQISNEVSDPTVVLSGANAPAEGERILVLGGFYFFTGAAFSVEDDQATGYSQVVAASFGSFVKAQQWLSNPYAGGPTCTVKINNNATPSNHYYTWMVLGLSGLLGSPVDTPALGTNSGNTSGTDGSVACAAALAQAANHVFAVFSSGQGSAGIALANPGGYDSLLVEDDGTANQTAAVAQLQTSAISTPNAQWSYTDNASGWAACIAPYKLAAAAAQAGTRKGASLASKIRGGLR